MSLATRIVFISIHRLLFLSFGTFSKCFTNSPVPLALSLLPGRCSFFFHALLQSMFTAKAVQQIAHVNTSSNNFNLQTTDTAPFFGISSSGSLSSTSTSGTISGSELLLSIFTTLNNSTFTACSASVCALFHVC